jgi:hypothetical protein
MAEEFDERRWEEVADPEITEVEKTLSPTIPDALLEIGTAPSSTAPNIWTLGEPDSSTKISNPLTSEETLQNNESPQISSQVPPANQVITTENESEEPLESRIRMIRIAPKVEVQKPSDHEANQAKSEDRNIRRPASAMKTEK